MSSSAPSATPAPSWQLTLEEFLAREGVGETAAAATALVACDPQSWRALVAFGPETLESYHPRAWRHVFRVGTREKPDSQTVVVMRGPKGTVRVLSYYEPRGEAIPREAFTTQPLGFLTGGILMREGVILDAWTDTQYRQTGLLLRLVREAVRHGAQDVRGPFSSARLGRLAHRVMGQAARTRGEVRRVHRDALTGPLSTTPASPSRHQRPVSRRTVR